MIINLPGKVQERLRKLLRYAAHENFIVRAGGEDAEVIGIFVERKVIDGGKQREVCVRVGVKLDVGCDVNFALLPRFDGD